MAQTYGPFGNQWTADINTNYFTLPRGSEQALRYGLSSGKNAPMLYGGANITAQQQQIPRAGFRIPGGNFYINANYPEDYELLKNVYNRYNSVNSPKLIGTNQSTSVIDPDKINSILDEVYSYSEDIPKDTTTKATKNAKVLDDLFGDTSSSSSTSRIRNSVGNNFKGRVSKLGTFAKHWAPGISDVSDINIGLDLLKNPVNKYDRAIGLGLIGLGGLGLGSLALAPATGGVSAIAGQGLKQVGKNAAKAVMKRQLRRALSEGGSKGLRRYTANKSIKEIAKAEEKDLLKRGNLANAAAITNSILHNPKMMWGVPIASSLYNWGRKQSPQLEEEADTLPIVDNDNATKTTSVEVNGKTYSDPDEDTPYIPEDIYNILEDINQPKQPMEDFVRDRVDKYGINAEKPEFDNNGFPLNKKALEDALVNNGWDKSVAKGVTLGLNSGDPKLDELIKTYNSNTTPDNRITIPLNQTDIDNARQKILEGYVGNEGGISKPVLRPPADIEQEYLNDLLNNYEQDRQEYSDYINHLNDAAKNRMSNWLIDFDLQRMGYNPRETYSEAYADTADLLKKAADANVADRNTRRRALSNYLLARELGLPLGSEYADSGIMNAVLDVEKSKTANYNKLMTELLKIQAQESSKELDRQNRIDIAKLKIDAANKLSALQQKQFMLKLEFERQKANMNFKQQEKLRKAINDTNTKINAAKILSEAGTYGVEDPNLIKRAADILGISLNGLIMDSSDEDDILNKLNEYER